ncbi:MAG: VTT domain-containing protein [Sandaracinaceae bacterium]|nr:VTT domain-containing protein [Sandaracinaceae bacterium]
MLTRTLCRPGPWLVVAFLAGAFGLERWVDSIGGPDALVERFGLLAPAVMVAIQAALSAAPFPSELFALVSSATYGWLAGSVMTWAGWTIGSMIQYALARRGAADVDLDERVAKLPAWLRRLPVTHPVFLVCVRWLPMGFHLANLAAGARRVPAKRQLWIAALGSIPGAVMWAGIGAGVSLL